MGLIAIIGQFDIHPEDVNVAGELMRVMTTETMKEGGCQHYAYSRDLVNPNRFQLSELWESDEALSAHFQAAHMAAYRAGMKMIRVERRVVRRYDIANTRDL